VAIPCVIVGNSAADTYTALRFRPFIETAETAMEATSEAFDRVPFNRLLGLRLGERAEPGRACVELDARDELMQENGVLHGGVISAAADTACVYAVLRALPPPKPHHRHRVQDQLPRERPGRCGGHSDRDDGESGAPDRGCRGDGHARISIAGYTSWTGMGKTAYAGPT
jgi:hypothetical protein